MASIKKFRMHSVGRLFLHNNRSPDDGVEHSNEEIDNDRTLYNYFLNGKVGNAEKLNDRISELFRIRTNPETDVVLAEVVVTLPKNVKAEDEREFFEAVYDFYAEDFGEKNIVNAVVHKDEKTPHLHLDFVPVVVDTKPKCKEGDMRYAANVKWLEEHDGKCERLCAKDAINREYLQDMHERLSDFVEDRLGYQAEILNGATENGNKKILQLKSEALKEQIRIFEQRLIRFQREAEEIHKAALKWGISEYDVGLKPLMQKIDDLEQKNAILQEIISREGYRYTRNDLDRLRQKKFTPSQAVSVSVFDGSLVQEEFEPNAIIVIEMPKSDSDKSPQWKMIAGNADIERQYKLASISTGKVSMKKSKVNNQVYIFLRPEGDERVTIDCLLEMERVLRENEEEMKGRRLYFDKIESDKFDLARSVLNSIDIPCNYYTRRDLIEKQGEERSKEQQLVQ